MTTISTDRLYATLVTGALSYVPKGGSPMSAALNSRLYRIQAAANAVYPYAVFSLRSPQMPQGFNSLKLVFDFEGFVWNRPRSRQLATETLGDTWASYLRTLRDISSGLLYATDVTSESLPQMSTPADGNIVQVLVRAKLVVWPQYIASLSS